MDELKRRIAMQAAAAREMEARERREMKDEAGTLTAAEERRLRTAEKRASNEMERLKLIGERSWQRTQLAREALAAMNITPGDDAARVARERAE